MEAQEDINKFSTVEIILGGLGLLIIDVVCALLDTTGFGWIIATPLQVGVSFLVTLWLLYKGEKRATKLERQLIRQAANFLPWVPTLLIAFIIEVSMHNNPKLKALAGKKAGVTNVGKK